MMKINNRNLFLSLFVGFCNPGFADSAINNSSAVKSTRNTKNNRSYYQGYSSNDRDTRITKTRMTAIPTTPTASNENILSLIYKIMTKVGASLSTAPSENLSLTANSSLGGVSVDWGKIIIDILTQIKNLDDYFLQSGKDKLKAFLKKKSMQNYCAELDIQDIDLLRIELLTEVSFLLDKEQSEYYNEMVDAAAHSLYNRHIIGVLLNYISYKCPKNRMALGSKVDTSIDGVGAGVIAKSYKVGEESKHYNDNLAFFHTFKNKKETSRLQFSFFQQLHHYMKGLNYIGQNILNATALMISASQKLGQEGEGNTVVGLQMLVKPNRSTKIIPLAIADTSNHTDSLQFLPALFTKCYEHTMSIGFDSKYTESKFNVATLMADINLLLMSNKTKEHKFFFGISGTINNSDKDKLEKLFIEWSEQVEKLQGIYKIAVSNNNVANLNEDYSNLKMAHHKNVIKKIASYILNVDGKYEYTFDGYKVTIKIGLPDLFFVSSKDKTLSGTECWNPLSRDIFTNLLKIAVKITKTFNEQIKEKDSKKAIKVGALLTL